MRPANPKGEYQLIEGVDHFGIIADEEVMEAIGAFLE